MVDALPSSGLLNQYTAVYPRGFFLLSFSDRLSGDADSGSRTLPSVRPVSALHSEEVRGFDTISPRQCHHTGKTTRRNTIFSSDLSVEALDVFAERHLCAILKA